MSDWLDQLRFAVDANPVLAGLPAAIEQVLVDDAFLFQRDVHERAICHRLASYLQVRFPSWHVDCEFNRDGHEAKALIGLKESIVEGEGSLVYPDIIVHKRGTTRTSWLLK